MPLFYLIPFGVSLLSSFVLTWGVRNLASGRGWIVPPMQDRDLQETRLPRLGGIPIFLSFLIGVAVAWSVSLHFPALAAVFSIRPLLTALVPGTLVFLFGLYDDIYPLGPYTRFAVQGVASFILFAGGLRILDLPVVFGARHLDWYVGLPITVLWVVGITNAFNLIVDGPVVSFGLPILETALSVLGRLTSGRPVFTSDRAHIYQKLLQYVRLPREVLIALYAAAALLALLSLFLFRPGGNRLGIVLVVIGACIWFGAQRWGYLEFFENRPIAQRTIEPTVKCANDLAIRRATEELKGASDYAQVCQILRSAFSANDFDGFELTVRDLAGQTSIGGERCLHVEEEESFHFEWSKPGAPELRDDWAAWSLTLQLSTSLHRWIGSMKIYRYYGDRDLLVNANLLTSFFRGALADALDRALVSKKDPVPK